ncbi:hypothetical protein CA267_008655 [Alteromonas pelagimontana]|uniref:Catalase n=1 Tax=Alteromonas pelagimontana TaxID=1858656 RepID=A0A6M4MFA6_9ALTE|nr:putative metalloprotease CJM1_0395 family protein [Alteromonas pelagimontana]QJR80846.1 hypothetical protein CA267_008655 [Alteromonas pelagimontana]
MNIVMPLSTNVVFTPANVNTEAARRENILRETIPPSADADKGASEQGLGSDAERARTPGQKPAPVTYERPQIQSVVSYDESQSITAHGEKDNARDESAGKEDAQQKQQTAQEVKALKERDAEVRTHEQAHAALGGQHAGSPQYEFENGPDGKRYAVGGEVAIDVSEAQTPAQTVQKMQQVRTAALAPAQPSAQDLQVASEAAQKTLEARQALAKENANEEVHAHSESSQEYVGQDSSKVSYTPSLRSSDTLMQTRIGVIQQRYSDTSLPKDAGFRASA